MTQPRSRRRTSPATSPVGGTNDGIAPPQPFDPEQYLASTDPDEGPLISPMAQQPPPGEELYEGDHRYVGPELPPEQEQTELSPEEQVTFASLLTCGRRSKTITIMDHSVVVQTLCGDDDLRIGMYVKDYQGSLGEQRAYQIGVVAAGIRSIDGKPMVQPLFETEADVLFDEKVAKVAQMYPTVINKIYRAVMDAEKEFVELATKLGKLDG